MPEVTFSVGMTCEGCSGAITRILSKIQGVSEVKCDIEKKEVTVTYDESETEPKVMHEKMQKWAEASGKELARAPSDGPMAAFMGSCGSSIIAQAASTHRLRAMRVSGYFGQPPHPHRGLARHFQKRRRLMKQD
eukprot:CAMPEP_0170404618 /NCGR_PEP_ID=MMETSP0117_2-20130122/26730_1 /TAXON_ID=400756 /ORGANISM="Durinskia baltica, Strain CSIRO CS-38" /LENGTH=133 /DNA_ID=CAMNT_0010661651 /DNA_START=109 /DNA_END=508 /DNA_ORIENTATION=-